MKQKSRLDQIKVSLLVTVLNEKAALPEWWRSLVWQIKLPDEVVVVDAGSSDGTVEWLTEQSAQDLPFEFRLLVKPGVNRSQGRNLAMKQSRHEWLAVTDAGVILDKDWLYQLCLVQNKTQSLVVAGSYWLVGAEQWFDYPGAPASPAGIKPYQSRFALSAQMLTVNLPQPGQTDYLPSSRSLLVHRTAWQQVGGYPEKLNTAEDLVFAYQLQQADVPQATADQAIVWWYPSTKLGKISKQFFFYALGDGLAGRQSPHFTKHMVKLMIAVAVLPLAIFWPASLKLCLAGLVLWWLKQTGRWIAKLKQFDLKMIFYLLFWIVWLWWISLFGFMAGLILQLRQWQKKN